MIRGTVLSLLLIVALASCAAQIVPPPSAQSILDTALQQAHVSDRTVFVIFHASWCGWCHKLDTYLNAPEVKPVIDANFIVIHIDVMERGAKKDSLENPGGMDMLKRLGGEKSGVPFYAFLNLKGTKIGDSNVMPDQQNIGYPGSEQEITAFGDLLKKSAPHMTEQQLATLLARLRKPS